jgi:hypothetical protein
MKSKLAYKATRVTTELVTFEGTNADKKLYADALCLTMKPEDVLSVFTQFKLGVKQDPNA